MQQFIYILNLEAEALLDLSILLQLDSQTGNALTQAQYQTCPCKCATSSTTLLPTDSCKSKESVSF